MIKRMLYHAGKELVERVEEALSEGLERIGEVAKEYKSRVEFLYIKTFDRETYNELVANLELYAKVMGDINNEAEGLAKDIKKEIDWLKDKETRLAAERINTRKTSGLN